MSGQNSCLVQDKDSLSASKMVPMEESPRESQKIQTVLQDYAAMINNEKPTERILRPTQNTSPSAASFQIPKYCVRESKNTCNYFQLLSLENGPSEHGVRFYSKRDDIEDLHSPIWK